MASRILSRQLLSSARSNQAHLLGAAPVARRMASGQPHYNEPSGFLFGDKPGPRVKEGWEDLYMYGMFGGMALMGVLYLYKPDTRLQTWALAEAKKNIEAEGGLPKWERS